MTDSTAVTRTSPDGATVAGSIFDNQGSFGLQLWSSFPPEEAGKVIGLVQGKATPLSGIIGKEIAVRHVLAHRVELVDEETGEVSTGDRIVLVNSAGEAFGSVSEGIRRSLSLLMQVYGKPPWTPPLVLMVEQIATGKGRRTFVLNPVTKG